MTKIIVFITYESPWYPAGGVAAVMAQLPKATGAASRELTLVMTPFHVQSARIAQLEKTQVASLKIPHGGGSIPVSVFFSDPGCPWYLLRPDPPAGGKAPPFFAGQRHPYDVEGQVLLRDALFFGAASVHALPAVAKHQQADPDKVQWHLMAQDWEGATALLAFASRAESKGRLHLTLHNSYDAFATRADFTRVAINPERCPGDTIVHRALSVVEPPALTVSRQFALDFTEDLLQREVMAPQLQDVLQRVPVVGVENGPFKPLALDPAHLRQAAVGDFGPLHDWKGSCRETALGALDAHAPTEDEPLWGSRGRFRRDDSPWFVMAGRDDPRQKGYDVAAAAIGHYLSTCHGQPGCARFLFFPIPGDEGLAGLTFLKDLAERFPEDILVFPFIWTAGFTAALQGAAYALMPSLYEPFGMANEFYLAGGCVGIGRATGGNLEQIVPLRAASACGRAVRIRADRYHGLSAHPSGILFRERDAIPSAPEDWRGINGAAYEKSGGSPNRVEERLRYAVFREMVGELRVAMEDGVRLCTEERELYYRMLAEGVAHIQRTFSWRQAGHEYARKTR